MSLDRLWAGWRSAYVSAAGEPPPPPLAPGTLFERILASGEEDAATGIVHRGHSCFAILNKYPYTSGHLLVLPYRPAPDVADLEDHEHDELWRTVRDALSAVRAAYSCEGVNVGANLGRASGAGVPDHLHIHVVPRWSGDTNFMTSVAESRVLPEPLAVSWQRISDAWPGGAVPATATTAAAPIAAPTGPLS